MFDKNRIASIINILNEINTLTTKTFKDTKEKIATQIMVNNLYDTLYKTYSREELLLAKDLLDIKVDKKKIKRHLNNHFNINKAEGKSKEDYIDGFLLVLLALVMDMNKQTRHNLWLNMIMSYKTHLEGGNYEYTDYKRANSNN